jgi:hypothetical protein
MLRDKERRTGLRWDTLFADLEAQVEALDRAELAGEIDERTRGEVAELSVHDRLRAAVGQTIRVLCQGGVGVTGELARVGADWLLLDEGAGREVVVVLDAVAVLWGLGRASAVGGSGGAVAARLGVRHVLRGIARDRLPVRLHLREGSTLDATIDRVGANFVEIAAHAPGELRRRDQVRQVELVALAALAAVRRAR